MADNEGIFKGTRVCSKCLKAMQEENFYKIKGGDRIDLCKKCLTMHVDNFNPETFLWILEKINVPYVEGEWNSLRDRAFAQLGPQKITGLSVLGKYLGKMRLNKWKDFEWKDTERIAAEAAEKYAEIEAERNQANEELKVQLEKGEISEAQYLTLLSVDDQYKEYKEAATNSDFTAPTPSPSNDYYDEEAVPQPFYGKDNPWIEQPANDFKMPEVGADMTDEEKTMLALKWGIDYTPAQWLALELDYQEMTNSFDIHDQDTKQTLIFLCKTNLKANEAIDHSDIDAFQKLTKVAENLRKTAKFTAAQKKQDESTSFNSVGLLVAYCEEHGGKIPRFEITEDLDKVDTIIRDQQAFTESLIKEDSALARQIEDYIKKRELLDEQKRDRENAKSGKMTVLTDEDILAHSEFKEQLRAQDEASLGDQEEEEE